MANAILEHTHVTFLDWFCCFKKRQCQSQSESFIALSLNGALETLRVKQITVTLPILNYTVETLRGRLIACLVHTYKAFQEKHLCIHRRGSETDPGVLLFLFCDNLLSTSRCSTSYNVLFWIFFPQQSTLINPFSLHRLPTDSLP